MSGGCDGKLVWWETAAKEPKPVRSIDAHQGWVRTLAVNAAGTIVATGGNDNMVRLWNLADGKLIRELPGHERHVYSVLFSSERRVSAERRFDGRAQAMGSRDRKAGANV